MRERPYRERLNRKCNNYRKRRREQKQREFQDLQAAGLIEPPEPRLTLQNFIRVMGDQAYVDPSQMERTVMEQVQKRQRAHLERNESKKLTKEQRAEKLRNKVLKDATPSTNGTGKVHGRAPPTGTPVRGGSQPRCINWSCATRKT